MITETRMPAGDLADRDSASVRYILNHSMGKIVDMGVGCLPMRVITERQRLVNDINTFRTEVQYGYSAPLADIARKYKEADTDSQGKSFSERLAARFSRFNGVMVITDFDGTITDDPAQYLDFIPGSVHAEPLLGQYGREAFPWVYPLTWQHILQRVPFAFNTEDAPVNFTAGVEEFFRYTQDHEIQITVLSANFEPFVKHQLNKIPCAEHVSLCAVTKDDIRSTAKDAWIKYLAAQNPTSAIIYLGDGLSDEETLQAEQVVALYGARVHQAFGMRLENHPADIPYFYYTNFHDVKKMIEFADGSIDKKT